METIQTEEQLQQAIVERVRQENAADDAGKRALAEPLPGPLRDAWALPDSIKVGPYEVRPFYDIDFEFLSLIQHPLYKEMLASQSGKEAAEEFFPRGPAAWELCWIMTRSVDDVEAAIKLGGRVALAAAAKKEFSMKQLSALMQLVTAATRQMSVYWSTAQTFGAAPANGEAANGERPPSGPPPTGSAGSSTRGASS